MVLALLIYIAARPTLDELHRHHHAAGLGRVRRMRFSVCLYCASCRSASSKSNSKRLNRILGSFQEIEPEGEISLSPATEEGKVLRDSLGPSRLAPLIAWGEAPMHAGRTRLRPILMTTFGL